MPTETNASETPATQPAQDNGKGESGKRHNQPDKPIMQARNKTGVVKWFSFKNGYGFITVDDDGDDIFVHRSEFIREGAREVFYHVNVGDKLEFDIINRAKGREAVAVTGPNGVRIPGSPANFGRGRGSRGRFNRNRNQDQFVDAEEQHDEETENKPPNGEAKKKNLTRGGGGRRRNASNEENGQHQGNGGENASGSDNKNGGNRRVRKTTGRRPRGPRNADAQEQQE